jgi:hypothetical protein
VEVTVSLRVGQVTLVSSRRASFRKPMKRLSALGGFSSSCSHLALSLVAAGGGGGAGLESSADWPFSGQSPGTGLFLRCLVMRCSPLRGKWPLAWA